MPIYDTYMYVFVFIVTFWIQNIRLYILTTLKYQFYYEIQKVFKTHF